MTIFGRYSLKFFCCNAAPFALTAVDVQPAKKRSKKFVVDNLELVLCCHRFLRSDPIFFRTQWNWSDFLQRHWNQGGDRQRLHANAILAILTNMNGVQLKYLNREIAADVQIADQIPTTTSLSKQLVVVDNENESDPSSVAHISVWRFASEVVTDVQGVLLTIFDSVNHRFYQRSDGRHDRTVMVESTRVNLRSLALGVSAGKAICLTGPVGCGKTTLVEFLARQTGRMPVRRAPVVSEEANGKENDDVDVVEVVNGGSTKKRKKKKMAIDADQPKQNDAEGEGGVGARNGFLRIQLGDQTDSKMLLGQYRCTDVPGEFVWQAGVLTQVNLWFMEICVHF